MIQIHWMSLVCVGLVVVFIILQYRETAAHFEREAARSRSELDQRIRICSSHAVSSASPPSRRDQA